MTLKLITVNNCIDIPELVNFINSKIPDKNYEKHLERVDALCLEYAIDQIVLYKIMDIHGIESRVFYPIHMMGMKTADGMEF